MGVELLSSIIFTFSLSLSLAVSEMASFRLNIFTQAYVCGGKWRGLCLFILSSFYYPPSLSLLKTAQYKLYRRGGGGTNYMIII